MKRAALSLMLSFAVAGSLYAAQDPAPQPATGALRQRRRPQRPQHPLRPARTDGHHASRGA